MKLKHFLAALAIAALPASAMALDNPKADVVLAVQGEVSQVNTGSAATFDLDMLEGLEQRTIRTKTPWHEGEVEFSGPLLRSVLEAAGAAGATMKVTALNDYTADVPVEDAETLDVILATRMNGKRMSVRDKGPLFVIYPFDTHPELYNEKYFSRSVWQIREIEVKD